MSNERIKVETIAIKILQLINLKKIFFFETKYNPIPNIRINVTVLTKRLNETKKFKKTAIKDKVKDPKKIDV